MHLVHILLPVRNAEGERFPRALYEGLVEELTQVFGGVTAYTRSPAAGLWESGSGETVRDDVLVYEVMVDHLDPAWWARLRMKLEGEFEQDELVVRAVVMQRL
jgi:hypothetical protein